MKLAHFQHGTAPTAPAHRALSWRTGPAMTCNAIAHARRLTRLTNCTFADGIAEALPADDGTYDVVVTSLMLHHLPESLRPQAIGEIFRVLRPGGQVLVADFRPPATRIGRHLISPVTSHAMQNNPVHLLEAMLRTAGFQHVHGGDVRPWIRYVRGIKPTSPR